MSHACGICDRQLARCEWCGESDPVEVGGCTYLVVTHPEWDGNYHKPCRDAELAIMGAK